jgi:hypothetical protein
MKHQPGALSPLTVFNTEGSSIWHRGATVKPNGLTRLFYHNIKKMGDLHDLPSFYAGIIPF